MSVQHKTNFNVVIPTANFRCVFTVTVVTERMANNACSCIDFHQRYLDAYLPAFLNSSERHFMLGLPVTYYVFTDTPEKVPDMKLPPLRSLKVVKVEKHSRWQDISMMRMKTISDIIETDIRRRCTHVFCFDVDQVFTGRFGSEALGDSVALLHAYYYRLPKSLYTYDRNPKSKAYMKTGDFYYHAAIFGGLCESVKAMADACYQSIMEDKGNNVEALWHDESHLNKYLWLHKPSRVLSPEYCWDPQNRPQQRHKSHATAVGAKTIREAPRGLVCFQHSITKSTTLPL